MKDLTTIALSGIFNDDEMANWRDRFSEKECETLIENSYTQIAKFNILYCDLRDSENDSTFEIGCLLCDRGFLTERGFHSHVRAKHFPQFEKIYALMKDEEDEKEIPKKHHKRAEVDGVLFSMEITRRLARNRETVLGWHLHAVEVNRKDGSGLVVHAFIPGDREYSEMVFHLAEEVIKERKAEAKKASKFERVFDRFVKLPEHDRTGVASYMLGLLSKRMTVGDLIDFEKQVDQIIEIRADFEAERKADLDRQHEIIDAAEELPDLELDESDITKDIPTEELPEDLKDKTAAEVFDDSKFENNEVDVSDCCHSEDVKSIQPPLRSSVQSSPDDPYYVCGSCDQKCEIETITRKELEAE